MSVQTRCPSAHDVRELRKRLCRWYVAHARDLPWRRTRDPFAIWISEAMLQQTRVETVIPYYERFLERFPDARTLAAATEDEVLALWSGLGYYRRARALHAAARSLAAEHGGLFPRDRASALALPGVGSYTAGAVLSIGYGLSEALVDGNVARVFTRLFDLDAALPSTALKRRLDELAERLVPPVTRPAARGVDCVAPGNWNQGLMELGALVCTTKAPRCADCPLGVRCRARARGVQEQRPVRVQRRAPIEVRLEVLVVDERQGLLLERRPASGRMAKMWELPTRELCDAGQATRLWPACFGAADPKLRLRAGAVLGRVGHSITHHRIQAEVRRGTLVGGLPRQAAWRFVAPAEVARLPVTGMTKKILSRSVLTHALG